MAQITLKGTTVNTIGELPQVGSMAPDFQMIATDLSVKTLADFKGKKIVLNIFPSVDTGTCAQSVRTFNQKASSLENTAVLCVSKDLPFALARFCGAEGLTNVVSLSDFRDGNFGKSYGLTISDGPLEVLHSRCVVIIDESGQIIYTEQVGEIVDEPNYSAAIACIE